MKTEYVTDLQKLLQASESWEPSDPSPQAKLSEYPHPSENPYTIVDSQGFHKGRKVDPFFHTIKDIPFRIFLTFHYRTPHFFKATQDAISARRWVIKDLLYRTKKELNLRVKDVQYFGAAERGDSTRIHTHTLIYLKDHIRHMEQAILTKLIKLMPRDIVDTPKPLYGMTPPNAELVRDSEAVSSYITKINDRPLHEEHHSDHFDKFVDALRKYQKRTSGTKV